MGPRRSFTNNSGKWFFIRIFSLNQTPEFYPDYFQRITASTKTNPFLPRMHTDSHGWGRTRGYIFETQGCEENHFFPTLKKGGRGDLAFLIRVDPCSSHF